MKQMEDAFRREAEILVDDVMRHAGDEIDAVKDITARYVHKVLPDLMGLPTEGRENMTPFGNAVWATMGPMNELFHEAMAGAGNSFEWVDQACNRENIRPDSLGGEMYAAADRGEISEQDAKLLTLTILSAGADTTVITMGNAINAFARFPEQYRLLRDGPVAAAQRLRRSAALGFAVAHGRTHRQSRTCRSTTTSSPKARAAG